ncbi:MAG: hypothetical protein J5707_02325 [Candidatus Methanomethylophilus sp.]|nr:hypothetical protein [Methanomethylophilus sp.]
MNWADLVVTKLKSMPHVIDVIVPEENDIEQFFDAESHVESGSGFILRNDALTESKKRTKHLCVLQDQPYFDRVPHHAMTWVTPEGDIIGFDVPPDLRHEVEGRNNLIWISSDFAMEPIPYPGDLTLVMHPAPIKAIGKDEGITDVISMFPSPVVDSMIRERYGITRDRNLATAILSFNDL